MTTIVQVLSPSTEMRSCSGVTTYNSTYGEMDDKGTAWHWLESTVERQAPPETAQFDDYGFRPYTNHWCRGSTLSATPGITVVQTMANCYGSDVKSRVTTRTGCWLTSFSMGALPTSDIDPDELNALVTQAYSDATASLFDASTSLGELPESLRMLAKTVDRINNIHNWTVDEYFRVMMKRYRNMSPKRLARELLVKGPQALSDFWLEYRYGWRPLKMEVEQLAKAVAHVRIGPNESITRGKARLTTTLANPSFTFGQNYNGAVSNVKQSTTTVQTCVRRDIVSVAAVVPNDVLAYRFDLLSSAWEWVPLSFVVDWVVDVSSFLQAASDQALNRAIRTTCCHSKTIEATALVMGQGSQYLPEEAGIYVEKSVIGTVSKFDYERKVLPIGIPQPRLNFKIKNYRDLRVLDLGALLIQRVSSLR